VPQGFFSMLNPFLHLEMDFKQQKIVISCKFISPDSGEKKKHFVEQLDNAIVKRNILAKKLLFSLGITIRMDLKVDEYCRFIQSRAHTAALEVM
jgi:hypothetical protein